MIQQKRESLKQHYQYLQSQGRGTYTFQSEEDVRRQNQTLTKLYKQLALADERGENSRDESSMSDGIELAYQEMIDNPDASRDQINRSQVGAIEEESKTEMVLVGRQEEPACKPAQSQEKLIQTEESVRSSAEGLTPANEYDVVIDSASNTFRAQQRELPRNLPEPSAQLFDAADQQQIKTARQEQVKTMSQINQRHERNQFSSNGSGADGPASTLSHFRSKSRPENETEQQYRAKLEANQMLIERLTGRPLDASHFDKHSVAAATLQASGHQDRLLGDAISAQTALERKKRRKEQIRLYKLMKTSVFGKRDSKSNQVSQHSSSRQTDFLSRTMQEAVNGSGIFGSRNGANELLSENIMDSRHVDERPDVNETVEKRKLVAYNNPAMLAQTMTLSIPERGSTDTEGANATLPTIRSTSVMQPPNSIQKKEAGFTSASSQERAGALQTSLMNLLQTGSLGQKKPATG